MTVLFSLAFASSLFSIYDAWSKRDVTYTGTALALAIMFFAELMVVLKQNV